MASIGQRLEHALTVRGMNAAALDLALAQRLGKKGRSSGYVHRVIKKGQIPGGDDAALMAEILDISLDWLLTGQGPIDRSPAHAATFDSLPGWPAAAEEEARRGRVQPYAIRAAGRQPASVRPVAVTVDFVMQTAMFWLAYAPEEEREAAMRAEAERIRAEEDAKRHD